MEASRELIERARRVGRREGAARTIAQSFSLLIGAGLIAVGVLGFVFGGSGFDAGGNPATNSAFVVFTRPRRPGSDRRRLERWRCRRAGGR
jgi:hypothetical protein